MTYLDDELPPVLGPVLHDVLGALHERLFPAGDDGPGAVEIGSVDYVEQLLSRADPSLVADYRLLLITIDQASRSRHRSGFVDLASGDQDDLLRALEHGGVLGPLPPQDQRRLFAMALEHVREGLFADPVHGGNRDGLGWRLLGHPGPRSSNSEADSFAMIDPGATDPGQQLGPRHAPIWDPELDDLAAESLATALGPPSEEVDVVVVGVGALGALASWVLVNEGLEVVGLEAGPWRTGTEFSPDELGQSFYGRAGLGEKFNRERPTWRPDVSTPVEDLGFSLGRMVNGVGGSLAQYAAWLRRFHEWHFRPRSHVVERFGEQVIPENSTLADWPLTYEDLEPYYTRVEHLIGVSGDESNPFIRRSRSLPMPPLREFPLGRLFSQAAVRRGMHPHPVPVGINSVPYAGRPATSYNAWSNGFGILDRDRWHPQFDLIPQAIGSGRFRLGTHCRAVEVLTGADGAACGVRYVNPRGDEVVQRARCVVVAAYTFETVRLLFLSRDARHLDGLGNNRGQLGQHFMPKMFVNTYGRFPGHRFNRHTGPAAQAMAVDDYLAGDLDAARLGFIGGGTMSVAQQALPLQISREARPGHVPAWGHGYREHVLAWQEMAGIWMQPDALPYRDNFLDLDPRRTECTAAGLPVIRVTYDLHENERRLSNWLQQEASALLVEMGATTTWQGPAFSGAGSSHDLGGSRSGHDPATSVVGPDLQVHDTPRLYVFSGAVLPTCPGINPTLTMWAWVMRAAEGVARTLSTT